MIRINLLGEKVDRLREYVLQLLIFGGSVALLVLLCVGTQIYLDTRVASLESEQAELQVKLTKLKQTTRKVEGLEKKKLLLKEKLRTIATLKAKKHGPVHVLDEINSRIPERAWLTGLTEQNGTLQITGVALDNQTIATFMNQLEQSPFIKEVDLIHSTQSVIQDAKLKEFSVSVVLRDLLEVQKYINAAPQIPPTAEQTPKERQP